MGNPFNLSDAIKFAVIFAFIIFCVSIANNHFGDAGVYLVAALSGIASVDAIVISMARLAGGAVREDTALTAILIAAHTNNLVKLTISVVKGDAQYVKVIGIGVSAMFVSLGVWAWGIGW